MNIQLAEARPDGMKLVLFRRGDDIEQPYVLEVDDTPWTMAFGEAARFTHATRCLSGKPNTVAAVSSAAPVLATFATARARSISASERTKTPISSARTPSFIRAAIQSPTAHASASTL